MSWQKEKNQQNLQLTFLTKDRKLKFNNMAISIICQKEKQVIIICLEQLEGNPKAEKTVSDLTAVELNKDNGMNLE